MTDVWPVLAGGFIFACGACTGGLLVLAGRDPAIFLRHLMALRRARPRPAQVDAAATGVHRPQAQQPEPGGSMTRTVGQLEELPLEEGSPAFSPEDERILQELAERERRVVKSWLTA